MPKRTSPIEFAHSPEKSGKGSTSNLSTKVPPPGYGFGTAPPPAMVGGASEPSKSESASISKFLACWTIEQHRTQDVEPLNVNAIS